MPRGNKRTYRGHELDSDFEVDILKNLYVDKRKLKKAFKFEHETEQLPWVVEGKYKPDFIITREDGHKIYVEAKGYLDNSARVKMLAVRRTNPDLDIRFLFYRDNKIRRGAKMTYTQWALRNGFQGAVVGDRVPVEWLLIPTEEEEIK